jgi:hypothetical protein
MEGLVSLVYEARKRRYEVTTVYESFTRLVRPLMYQLRINPFPTPGIGVGSVHGRRDAGSAPTRRPGRAGTQ